VASRSFALHDASSRGRNHAHANQTIDMSGAVSPLANQRCRIPTQSICVAGVVRLARLCVLIELNPARRTVHMTSPDIASSSTLAAGLADRLRRVSSEQLNPPEANGPGISDDAVSTYNLCSCGPEIPAIPKRVKPLQSCLRACAKARKTWR
jgi:hypothetical protein